MYHYKFLDPIKKKFYARGKLLLTGEYAVLHGAKAVALPLKVGQRMTVTNARGSDLIWEALDDNGDIWYESQMSLYDFSDIKTSDEQISKKLAKILKAAVRENSEFLSTWSGFKVETQLEFPLNWGLGSSSTLIANVAEWAEVNAFHLYFAVANGSGYDIACANADEPIHYQLGDESLHFNEIEFKPSFLNKLFFVYQGAKQDSESSVNTHGKKFKGKKDVINRISAISDEIIQTKNLQTFNNLLEEHETIIAGVIGEKPVKERLFPDFEGTIKSLGAWGGDFILATTEKGEDYVKSYFASKKLDIVKPYQSIVL